MKSEVAFKFLSYFSNKKRNNDEGFTLIELLVVVIIIGVLTAVALPNLLNQIGKARETEGTNALGTINRQQQAYHFEKGTFTGNLSNAQLQAANVLGVIIPQSKYYDTSITTTTPDICVFAIVVGVNTTGDIDHGAAQGTRDQASGICYNPPTTGGGDPPPIYPQIICRSEYNTNTPVITDINVAQELCPVESYSVQ